MDLIEEEAAVRARLEGIQAERESLLVAAAALRDAKLSALNDEEAELLRRLESGELAPRDLSSVGMDSPGAYLIRLLVITGELTAEEEAEVRRRLKAIAAEREAVYAEYSAKAAELGGSSPKGRPKSPRDSAQLASQVKAFDEELQALDNEEAELMRRLASGELSAEEEAAVRARLAEIDGERRLIEQARHAALAAAGQTEMLGMDRKSAQLAAELAAVDAQLSALDDEEAELMRRLASGELTPEEEAAVKARLAAIASERGQLLDQRKSVLKAQADMKQKHAREKRMNEAARRKKAASSRKLSLLDDEEAELRRKLASVIMTPAERAAALARLDAIATERAAIEADAEATGRSGAAAMEMVHLVGQLSALDDEMAELLRRLESGECTPEEEAAIRARLAAIELERDGLMAKKQLLVEQRTAAASVARQARLEMQVLQVKNQLAALDKEEADLLRRLALGDLSPEEEAEIHARLAAIGKEREKLEKRLDERLEMMKQEAENSKLSLNAQTLSKSAAAGLVKMRAAVRVAEWAQRKEREKDAAIAAANEYYYGGGHGGLSFGDHQEEWVKADAVAVSYYSDLSIARHVYQP